MIVPQLACGGWTPMPRIERADSVKMLRATIKGKKTITLGATLGRISLRKMCQSDAPEAIASWFLQAEDGKRDTSVTGVQTCALPISVRPCERRPRAPRHLRGGRSFRRRH